ncbi:hypothetical protein PENSTE_c041G01487 [Penicillium steckii]|uniref:Uncharacterized protein n=1 Tax=Penicillium steckii TaxID=303698 RepID=A0A1V6SJR8_9EURO|nr:hypothetical protein PENSTE_c041G01487 [Penicillium steckii]
MRACLDLETYKFPNAENLIGPCTPPVRQSRIRARYRAKPVLRSYRYLSTLFHMAISMSFSLSVGAGAFSISPSLRIQKVSDLETSLPYLITEELRRDRVSDGSCASVFERAVNNCISQFQIAFSEKKATPFDAYFYRGNSKAIPIVDAVVPWSLVRWRDELPSLRRFTRFLIECGSLPDNTLWFGVLRDYISNIPLEEDDLSFVTDLVDFGGPLLIYDLPLSTVARRNIKYMVSQDEGLVSFSDNEMIIFRESQGELQRAAELGNISTVDMVHGSPSILGVAFGWPDGVAILLKFGADAKQITLESLSYWTRYIDELDVDFNAYYESTRLVLEAGCIFGVSDIDCRFSRKLQALLAHELAKRRWTLWRMARSQLPDQTQMNLTTEKDTVPDIYAAGICKAFAAQGREVGPHLQVGKQSSVYHEYSLSIEAMEELFSAGFRDLNCLDSSGVTPLMVTQSWLIGRRWCVIRRAAWMISKGADTHKNLPRSNATIAHLLSAELTGILLFLSLNGSLQPGNLVEFQFWMERISPHKYPIFVYPSIRDNCACACCPTGCTTLSVALRQVCRWKWWSYVQNRSFIFRRILRMLVDFTASGPSVSQTIIRCLSFDAIGLRHICCIEIEDRETAENMESMEESEISEILEEDTRGLEEFEQLVLEFERKLDETGLPILEFLESFWFQRMVEYLSNRDPYDEEHNMAMNRIGIDVRAEESVPFDRVSLLIGDSYDGDHDRRARAIDLEAGESLSSNYLSLLLHASGILG